MVPLPLQWKLHQWHVECGWLTLPTTPTKTPAPPYQQHPPIHQHHLTNNTHKNTSTHHKTPPSRHLKEASNAFDTQHQLHTFSIGIKGSPDLLAARKVADQLGTQHHEFTFTVQEGIDALPNLIYHIESYEQVRAAVPMYLLSRKIKALGIKVVLSGEGADEAFGGYLYFHKVRGGVGGARVWTLETYGRQECVPDRNVCTSLCNDANPNNKNPFQATPTMLHHVNTRLL